jgi:hypothetical protein
MSLKGAGGLVNERGSPTYVGPGFMIIAATLDVAPATPSLQYPCFA